jgi:hypothetical protein
MNRKKNIKSINFNSKPLVQEEIDNNEWMTIEEVRQFIKNNVREIYKNNGSL